MTVDFPHHRLHAWVWKLLRPVMRLTFGRAYHFSSSPVELPEGPCLIYANHVTYGDPFLLGIAFPRQMYFVASEHLARHPLARIMISLAAPILRQKSTTETQAALDILRRLRRGCSVCVFVEGERSYGGFTEHIPDSAAHLAQLSGASLVTYRLEGGYLADPRWRRFRRQGQVRGRVVHIYSPQELKSLSRSQVLDAIRGDLWEDAYQRQAEEMRPYPGRCLAEHVETTLFLCPRCGRIDGLKSRGCRLTCSCGLDLLYTEYGYLEGVTEEAPFSTVSDWYCWELAELPAWLQRQDKEAPLICEDDQELSLTPVRGNHPRLLGKGRMELYGDRLVFTSPGFSLTIPLEDINGFSNHGAMLVNFSHGPDLYQLRSAYPRSGQKYRLIFDLLRSGAGI